MKLRGTLLLTTCLTVFLLAAIWSCRRGEPEGAGGSGKVVLRLGHFPNLTHAQGLVAHALSRQGKGWFEERLGPQVEVQWFIYNAGPSVLEAIFARSIDLTYVGPSPALNGFLKSDGQEVRIISGAAEGGAGLVVQGDGRIKTPADFRGKKVATPQLGNTQDVACRAWLLDKGFKVTQLGGDVQVIPTANPDQLTLFQKGTLDAVWTVEPWLSRLEMEAGGKLFLLEDKAVTTLLVSRASFLQAQPELARKFTRAHDELTEWIKAHPEESQRLIQEELKAETSRSMPPELLLHSWPRLHFTSDLQLSTLEGYVTSAKRVGFLSDVLDLRQMVAPR
jgi:NitT/TauT family transport system substrate-binding protein